MISSACSVFVHKPLVALAALSAAQWRGESHFGMAVGEMQADCGSFEKNQITIDQHGYPSGRIEGEIFGALVRMLIAIDENEFVGRADLFQNHVRREIGVAGIEIKLIHEQSQLMEIRFVFAAPGPIGCAPR